MTSFLFIVSLCSLGMALVLAGGPPFMESYENVPTSVFPTLCSSPNTDDYFGPYYPLYLFPLPAGRIWGLGFANMSVCEAASAKKPEAPSPECLEQVYGGLTVSNDYGDTWECKGGSAKAARWGAAAALVNPEKCAATFRICLIGGYVLSGGGETLQTGTFVCNKGGRSMGFSEYVALPSPRAYASATYSTSLQTMFVVGGDDTNDVGLIFSKTIACTGWTAWQSAPNALAAGYQPFQNIAALSLLANSVDSTHLALSGGYNCAGSACTLRHDMYRLSLLTSNATSHTFNLSEPWAPVAAPSEWVDLVGIPMRIWQPIPTASITSPTLSLDTHGSPVTPVFAYDGFSLYVTVAGEINVWSTIASVEEASQIFVRSHTFNPNIAVTYNTDGIAIIASQQADGIYRRLFASRCNMSAVFCEENELALGCAITPFNHVCEPCIVCNASNGEVEFASCGISAEMLPFQTVCAACQNCSLQGISVPAPPGTFPPDFDCTAVCPSGAVIPTWQLAITRTEISITTGVLCGAYLLAVAAYIAVKTFAFPALQRVLAGLVQLISGGSVVINYAACALLLSLDDANSKALGVLGLVLNTAAFFTTAVPAIIWGLRNLSKAKENRGEWSAIWVPKVHMMQASLVRSGDPLMVRRFAQATLLMDLVCKDAAFLVISAVSINFDFAMEGHKWGPLLPLIVSIACLIIPVLSGFFVKRVPLHAHTPSSGSLTAALVREVEFTRNQYQDDHSVDDLHLRVAVINTAASSSTTEAHEGEASPPFADSRASLGREAGDSEAESDSDDSDDVEDGAVRGVPGSFGVILHEVADNRDNFIDIAEPSVDGRSEWDNPATVCSSMPNQSVRLEMPRSEQP